MMTRTVGLGTTRILEVGGDPPVIVVEDGRGGTAAYRVSPEQARAAAAALYRRVFMTIEWEDVSDE